MKKKIKISILCSDKKHPVYNWLKKWIEIKVRYYDVELVSTVNELTGGDFLFLISVNEIVKKEIRQRYKYVLVIHASDLPLGRGWSPHIWQILEGKNMIKITLLEAEDKVDSGRIWMQRTIELAGHELYDEINEKLFLVELELMDFAIDSLVSIKPVAQREDIKPTYYSKRKPENSRLDPEKTIAEQFELLRIADPNRYPAFFDYRGHRYNLYIKKARTE